MTMTMERLPATPLTLTTRGFGRSNHSNQLTLKITTVTELTEVTDLGDLTALMEEGEDQHMEELVTGIPEAIEAMVISREEEEGDTTTDMDTVHLDMDTKEVLTVPLDTN